MSGDEMVKVAALDGDPLDMIISWTWYLGEVLGWYTSTSYDSRNPPPQVYPAGNFMPNLTACCAICCNSTTGVVTAVVNNNLVANFNATPRSVSTSLPVQFNETSTGSPVSWTWNFGDGHSSPDKDPSHTYNSAGNFTVSLTVTNATASNTTVRQNFITVTDQTTIYNVYAETGNIDEYVNAYKFHSNLLSYAQSDGTLWQDWNGGSYIPHQTSYESHWTYDAENWVQKADFAYFSGHGSPNKIWFDNYDPVSNLNHSTTSNMSLGLGKTKWVVLDSCASLEDSSVNEWKSSFHELHMLLGWNTSTTQPFNPSAMSRGELFTSLMQGKYPGNGYQKLPITAAWDMTCLLDWQNAQSSTFDVWNAIIYDETCKNEYLPGYGGQCSPSGSYLYNSTLVYRQNNQPASAAPSRSLSLVAGKYSVNGIVPVVPDKIMIYVLDKTGFTKASASSLAKSLGMSGEIREAEKAFIGGESEVEYYYFAIEKDTSTISFIKLADKPGQSRSKLQSVSSVDSFLRENNLMHPDVIDSAPSDNTGKSLIRSNEREFGQKTGITTLSRAINGLPVYNSQIMIERDSEGNIIKFFQNWRNYKSYKEVALKTPETVIDEFKTVELNTNGRSPDVIVITDVSLGYYSHASVSSEKYLQPIYVIKGFYQDGDTTHPFEPVIISATDEIFDKVPGLVEPPKQHKTEPKNDVTFNITTSVTPTVSMIQNILIVDTIVPTISPTIEQNLTIEDTMNTTTINQNFLDITNDTVLELSNITMNNESISGKLSENPQSGV